MSLFFILVTQNVKDLEPEPGLHIGSYMKIYCQIVTRKLKTAFYEVLGNFTLEFLRSIPAITKFMKWMYNHEIIKVIVRVLEYISP